jgi:hypothetical protein
MPMASGPDFGGKTEGHIHYAPLAGLRNLGLLICFKD